MCDCLLLEICDSMKKIHRVNRLLHRVNCFIQAGYCTETRITASNVQYVAESSRLLNWKNSDLQSNIICCKLELFLQTLWIPFRARGVQNQFALYSSSVCYLDLKYIWKVLIRIKWLSDSSLSSVCCSSPEGFFFFISIDFNGRKEQTYPRVNGEGGGVSRN